MLDRPGAEGGQIEVGGCGRTVGCATWWSRSGSTASGAQADHPRGRPAVRSAPRRSAVGAAPAASPRWGARRTVSGGVVIGHLYGRRGRTQAGLHEASDSEGDGQDADGEDDRRGGGLVDVRVDERLGVHVISGTQVEEVVSGCRVLGSLKSWSADPGGATRWRWPAGSRRTLTRSAIWSSKTSNIVVGLLGGGASEVRRACRSRPRPPAMSPRRRRRWSNRSSRRPGRR